MIDLKPDKVVKIPYQCQVCGELDWGKYFQDEMPAQQINCWNCHNKNAMVMVQPELEA